MSNAAAQKNKPANTLFKQQRLASWQPIMSPPHVCACFVTVAAIFIPIGVAIFTANSGVVDLEARYDNANSCTPNNNQGAQTYSWVNNGTTETATTGCRSYVTLQVPSQLEPPIYMYYGLKNFYQNHRSYAKSRVEKQLAGKLMKSDDGDLDDARPLRHPGENLLSAQYGTGQPITVNGQATSYESMTYSPAGLVPWSMFNDTFKLYYVNTGDAANTKYELVCDSSLFRKVDSSPIQPSWIQTNNKTLFGYDYTFGGDWNFTCQKENIAWESDREVKFKQPGFSNTAWTAKRTEYLANATATDYTDAGWNATYIPTSTDPFFENGWYAGEPGHQVPVNTDEDLMVWMRTSALPNFRKLFRIITVPIPAGEYLIEIDESFDVSSFAGEKYVALATVSWIGGKNGFLGIAYIAVGAVAFVAGVVFFLVHRLMGDRTQRAVDALNDLQ